MVLKIQWKANLQIWNTIPNQLPKIIIQIRIKLRINKNNLEVRYCKLVGMVENTPITPKITEMTKLNQIKIAILIIQLIKAYKKWVEAPLMVVNVKR